MSSTHFNSLGFFCSIVSLDTARPLVELSLERVRLNRGPEGLLGGGARSGKSLPVSRFTLARSFLFLRSCHRRYLALSQRFAIIRAHGRSVKKHPPVEKHPFIVGKKRIFVRTQQRTNFIQSTEKRILSKP